VAVVVEPQVQETIKEMEILVDQEVEELHIHLRLGQVPQVLELLDKVIQVLVLLDMVAEVVLALQQAHTLHLVASV